MGSTRNADNTNSRETGAAGRLTGKKLLESSGSRSSTTFCRIASSPRRTPSASSEVMSADRQFRAGTAASAPSLRSGQWWGERSGWPLQWRQASCRVLLSSSFKGSFKGSSVATLRTWHTVGGSGTSRLPAPADSGPPPRGPAPRQTPRAAPARQRTKQGIKDSGGRIAASWRQPTRPAHALHHACMPAHSTPHP